MATETRHPVVDLDGFRVHTSMEVPVDLEALVTQRLVQYQDEAESILRRPCWVEVTDEVVTDQAGALLVTRRRPVIEVATISGGPTYHITSGGLISLGSDGLSPTYSPLVSPTAPVTVSYTSRLRPEDEGAVTAMIYDRMVRALVREVDKAQGVTSVGEEGYTITLIEEGWTQGERDDLRAMRRRVSR